MLFSWSLPRISNKKEISLNQNSELFRLRPIMRKLVVTSIVNLLVSDIQANIPSIWISEKTEF